MLYWSNLLCIGLYPPVSLYLVLSISFENTRIVNTRVYITCTGILYLVACYQVPRYRYIIYILIPVPRYTCTDIVQYMYSIWIYYYCIPVLYWRVHRVRCVLHYMCPGSSGTQWTRWRVLHVKDVYQYTSTAVACMHAWVVEGGTGTCYVVHVYGIYVNTSGPYCNTGTLCTRVHGPRGRGTCIHVFTRLR